MNSTFRYVVKSYRRQDKNGANMWYKVVDTFNGGKVVRNGISSESDAKQYAAERNTEQARAEAR
jgi:hypothetical protein